MGPEPFATKPSGDEAVRSAQAAADSARAAAVQARSAHEPEYLRFKADEVQLSSVRDDGRFTYLEFAAPVAAGLEVFDQEGRPLASASAGRVTAVEGLHPGILVRRSDRAGFVSPNPRALSLPRRPLPDNPDYGEARAKLENAAGQLQAMQRAIEAAKLIVAPDAVAARPVPAASSAPVPYPMAQPVTSQLKPSAMPSVMPSVMPLAVASASASAPERGLVRVFFATASRAIVAPDDGLGLLLREAGNADQIRVTGYTDATGSRATNEALAVQRADAVVQILLRRGVPAERIFSSAVGADEYIADNAS